MPNPERHQFETCRLSRNRTLRGGTASEFEIEKGCFLISSFGIFSDFEVRILDFAKAGRTESSEDQN